MVDLFVGRKGKGKTKYLLDDVNTAVKSAKGNVVFLDKSSDHMHELSTKARLINVTDYALENEDEFIGFILGIISQDYDLELMYIDSFLKVAHLEGKDIEATINRLHDIGEKRNIRFALSVSADKSELPEGIHKFIKVSL